MIAVRRYHDAMTSGSSPQHSGRATRLEEHLAEQDEPCPRCAYNLRRLRGTVCPECGLPLRLFVGEDGSRPRRQRASSLAAIIGLTGLGAAFGSCALGAIAGFGFLWGAGAIVNGALLAMWVRAETTGWLRRLSHGERIALALACWVPLVLILASIS